MENPFQNKFDKKSVKMLAFDIDGTLFSSEEIILATYQEAIKKYMDSTHASLTYPSQEKIMEQIGKPVKTIFLNLFPETTSEDRDMISNFVLEILCNKIADGEGYLYKGVEETIQKLSKQNFLIAAASNGRKPYIKTILKTHNVLSYFQELVVLDYQTIKAKGDILDYYKSFYKLQGSEIAMIGDRSSDRDAALQSGSHFVFTSYGHASPNEIPNYTLKIDSITELLDLLL